MVQKVHEAVDENLLLLMDKDDTLDNEEDNSSKVVPGTTEDTPIYFR